MANGERATALHTIHRINTVIDRRAAKKANPIRQMQMSERKVLTLLAGISIAMCVHCTFDGLLN